MADALLYRVEGRLFPEASRSHLEFRLFLPREFEALEIRFAYAPKLLEDPARIADLASQARMRFAIPDDHADPASLQNLLTLSFDDARGFRGAAHRHPPDQTLVLGPSPSPGIHPGPVPQGLFRITLSVHAVLTDSCSYQIAVRAWEACP